MSDPTPPEPEDDLQALFNDTAATPSPETLRRLARAAAHIPTQRPLSMRQRLQSWWRLLADAPALPIAMAIALVLVLVGGWVALNNPAPDPQNEQPTAVAPAPLDTAPDPADPGFYLHGDVMIEMGHQGVGYPGGGGFEIFTEPPDSASQERWNQAVEKILQEDIKVHRR